MDTVRVLIVAADPLSRSGLSALLAGESGVSVAGQTAGTGDLASDLETYRPDVLLWDLGWETAASLEKMAGLGSDHPPVLALLPNAGLASQAWNAGARGLLLRTAEGPRVASAITALAQDLMALDPEIGASVRLPAEGGQPTLAEGLTPREMEVLRLVADGLPNKEIARRLKVSEHTVKFHLNAVMGKLGAQSRTEAVVTATRQGLIML
jgi:two-component system nitrate/nitrite response regulator NarL